MKITEAISEETYNRKHVNEIESLLFYTPQVQSAIYCRFSLSLPLSDTMVLIY